MDGATITILLICIGGPIFGVLLMSRDWGASSYAGHAVVSISCAVVLYMLLLLILVWKWLAIVEQLDAGFFSSEVAFALGVALYQDFPLHGREFIYAGVGCFLGGVVSAIAGPKSLPPPPEDTQK
jgi:hypothetical protein